jgi:hypothetical protein
LVAITEFLATNNILPKSTPKANQPRLNSSQNIAQFYQRASFLSNQVNTLIPGTLIYTTPGRPVRLSTISVHKMGSASELERFNVPINKKIFEFPIWPHFDVLTRFLIKDLDDKKNRIFLVLNPTKPRVQVTK